MEPIGRRRIAITLLAVGAVFGGGTAGFMAILHESWHEALYRTIVTASLTGLDTQPKGVGAEALTVALVIGGVAIFGYLAAQVVDRIAHGILGGAWREKRRRKLIEELREHVIICGYGRVGRRAAEELRLAGVPYVVLDFGETALAHARDNDELYIAGNGSDDADLSEAGIDRASGLLAASDGDAENLYITLSAKARRPDLNVVARASSEDAGRKLRLAGADGVVAPYTAAGQAMANLLVKPQVTAFVHTLTSAASPEFSIDELEVRSGCPFAGQTIADVELADAGAYVIAIRQAGGEFRTRPPRETRLEVGDVVVAVGAREEIRTLETLFASPERVG